MKIQVNYQELYQSGNYLHSQADQYEQLIERINQLMLSTSSVWQGSDNDAFIEQVEILRPQLMRMVYVIESYADVLKTMQITTLPEPGVAGRGLVETDGVVLEFQTCLAVLAEDDYNRIEQIRKICQYQSGCWKGKGSYCQKATVKRF